MNDNNDDEPDDRTVWNKEKAYAAILNPPSTTRPAGAEDQRTTDVREQLDDKKQMEDWAKGDQHYEPWRPAQGGGISAPFVPLPERMNKDDKAYAGGAAARPDHWPPAPTFGTAQKAAEEHPNYGTASEPEYPLNRSSWWQRCKHFISGE